jgi:hypothetical protein
MIRKLAKYGEKVAVRVLIVRGKQEAENQRELNS